MPRANASASTTCCGVAGLQDQAGRAAAHVGRPHARVPEVARLDRPRATAGSAVVVDAVAPLGQRRRPSARGAGRGAAGRRARGARPRAPPERPRRRSAAAGRVVGHEDERADAVLEGQREQLVDPLRGSAVEELPQTLSSRRISRGSRPAASRGLVDDLVARRELARLQVAERRQPAVRLARRSAASMRGL